MRMRFSLRWLLVALVVIACLLAYLTSDIRAAKRRAYIQQTLSAGRGFRVEFLEGAKAPPSVALWNRWTGDSLPAPFFRADILIDANQRPFPARALELLFEENELTSIAFWGSIEGDVLARFPNPEKVTYLALNGCPEPTVLRELYRFSKLKKLFVSNRKINDEDATNIANLQHLIDLTLEYCLLAENGLDVLAKPPISELSLVGSQFTEAGLGFLTHMKLVQSLDLTKSKLTDGGATVLLQVSQLKTLNLSLTEISDAALPQIAEMKELQTVDLRGTRVTGPGLDMLQKAPQLNHVSVWDEVPISAELKTHLLSNNHKK